MMEWIRKLSASSGPSGYEVQVTDVIRELVQSQVDELYADSIGNLYAIKKGKEVGGNAKTILVAAHVDEPALTVIDVGDDGFLRVEPLGNLKAHALVGARLIFPRTGRRGVVGVEHGVELKDIAFHQLFVDIGVDSKEAAEEVVRIGDAATFGYQLDEVGQDVLVGQALDNRVSCAILVDVLRRIHSPHTIVAVFTAQKEVGSRGAQLAGYRVQPDLAVVLDVSPAGDTPKGERIALQLGKGPAIKALDAGMVVAPVLRERMAAAARGAGVPFQFEVSPHAKSDAGALFLNRDGIPTCGIAVPARYVGTPSQMVHEQDILGAAKLLESFLASM